MKSKIILAIETSCDDTSIAIYKNDKLIAMYAETTLRKFREFGGIVPEIAARGHEDALCRVFKDTLKLGKVKASDITEIAYTALPGLPGSLHVGKVFAKTLSFLLDVPLIPIDHMMGHIFSFGINNPKVIRYPFLSLVASGGHTCIYKVDSPIKVKKLNETTDDAIGEALDKIGRSLGMEYPGGVSIDRSYNASKATVKMPDHHKASDNFSFSGLKNHILNVINTNNMKKNKVDSIAIGSSALKWMVDDVDRKLEYYAKKYKINVITIGGGVSANSLLRNILQGHKNWKVVLPELKYTGDNAGMIAFYALLLKNDKRRNNRTKK